MIQLEMTVEEAGVLAEELHSRLSELNLEIQHTDRGDFKSMLKRRRETLTRIEEKLARQTPTP